MGISDFFLSLTIILLYTIASYSQAKHSDSDIILRDGDRYFYMDKSFSYDELGPQFLEYREFMDLYMRSNQKKKSAKILGFSTIGIGIWGLVMAENCKELGCILLVFPMTIGAITGTITLIQLLTSSTAKKQSIKVLNNSLAYGNLDLKYGSSLSIGASINGIGFFFRF